MSDVGEENCSLCLGSAGYYKNGVWINCGCGDGLNVAQSVQGQEAQESNQTGDSAKQEAQSYFSDPMTDKVEVFKDSAGEWRWRRVAQNGNIISTGGEGYVNKADCVAIAARLNPSIRLNVSRHD